MKGDMTLTEAWMTIRLACFKSAGIWEKVHEACNTVLYSWHVPLFKPRHIDYYWFWCSVEGQLLAGAMYNILRPDLIKPQDAAELIGVKSVTPYINTERLWAFPVPAWIDSKPAQRVKKVDPEQVKRIRWLVRASACLSLKRAHEKRVAQMAERAREGLIFGRVEDLMREPGIRMPESYRPRRG